jgi:hypothetical protein
MRKLRNLVLLATLLVASLGAKAQLKVKSTGATIVGTEISSNDANNVVSMQVSGNTYGPYYPSAKISFGDFGRKEYYGWNVFIGEYLDYDTDCLWLHGKNGLAITANGDGSDLIARYETGGRKFTFNCDMYAYGVKLTSDGRLKTDVNKIGNSRSQLRKLNGVSYHLLNKEEKVPVSKLKSLQANDTIALTEKEKRNKAEYEALAAKRKANTPKRMGFIAQDLLKVYPELVSQDSSGYYAVDYIGLIPVIVEAMKEQDSLIESQNETIKSLKSQVATLIDCCEGKSKSKNKSLELDNATSTNLESAILYQNSPNPFSETTQIKFYLPTSVKNAALYIYDMQGIQKKKIEVSQRANGSVTIHGSEFVAGMYIYTLIADGKEIDTKRMILTE